MIEIEQLASGQIHLSSLGASQGPLESGVGNSRELQPS